MPVESYVKTTTYQNFLNTLYTQFQSTSIPKFYARPAYLLQYALQTTHFQGRLAKSYLASLTKIQIITKQTVTAQSIIA